MYVYACVYIYTRTHLCAKLEEITVKNPKIALNLKTRPDGNFSF